MSYGAHVWAREERYNEISKILLKAQRLPLLGINGAYRTVATNALQVLAGVPPLDLHIRYLARVQAYPLLQRTTELRERLYEEMLTAW